MLNVSFSNSQLFPFFSIKRAHLYFPLPCQSCPLTCLWSSQALVTVKPFLLSTEVCYNIYMSFEHWSCMMLVGSMNVCIARVFVYDVC